jgi:6,7-dimethyl-8-ribityllumazine synthase
VPPGHYHILALDLFMVADDALFESHDGFVKLAALGKPVVVGSKQHFDWVAPVVTEKMMRLKATLGLPAAQ